MDDILAVKDLSIKVKGNLIFKNISFSVKPGDVVLLSGENGVGKSTILKAIMRLETEGKDVDGEIIVENYGNVLLLDDQKLQDFRSKVAYVRQKDEYSEMGSVQVRDIIGDSVEASKGKKPTKEQVNDLIDEWIPRRADSRRIFDAKSKPLKFSGGEQRLLSVLSVIAARPDAKLMIIDEPLNNLDYINARNISNMLNRVIKKNPEVGILIISHCRIFPFITREIRMTSEGIVELKNSYQCHSCFGEPNAEGYYL